jgi:hypothetical protein
MKLRRISWARPLCFILLPVMGLACVVFAVRVARHFRGARVELGSLRITELSDATKTRLRTLNDRVFLTYYVSPRQEMP